MTALRAVIRIVRLIGLFILLVLAMIGVFTARGTIREFMVYRAVAASEPSLSIGVSRPEVEALMSGYAVYATTANYVIASGFGAPVRLAAHGRAIDIFTYKGPTKDGVYSGFTVAYDRATDRAVYVGP